jgi:hypothetical protein
MAIEGPLHELGIHDVFQLLDLNRKTGALTVTSFVRDNRGTVYFDRGAVVYAAIRSNPHPLGQLLLRAGKISEGDLSRAQAVQQRGGGRPRLGEVLVELGAISRRELERQVRFQVEEVVFELMSWQEGFFSFEEGEVREIPAEAAVRISTASVLMEGARRIDEWSRIVSKVPHLGMVAALAPVSEEQSASLDLLPGEWEVLIAVDGVRDLRTIAHELARSDFDVARTVYGLVSTGVLELRDGVDAPTEDAAAVAVRAHLDRARASLVGGDAENAVSAGRMAVAITQGSAEARAILAAALTMAGRHDEAAAELQHALEQDAANPMLHRALGCCAARRGALDEAVTHWRRYLELAPDATSDRGIHDALEGAAAVHALLREPVHV